VEGKVSVAVKIMEIHMKASARTGLLEMAEVYSSYVKPVL